MSELSRRISDKNENKEIQRQRILALSLTKPNKILKTTQFLQRRQNIKTTFFSPFLFGFRVLLVVSVHEGRWIDDDDDDYVMLFFEDKLLQLLLVYLPHHTHLDFLPFFFSFYIMESKFEIPGKKMENGFVFFCVYRVFFFFFFIVGGILSTAIDS